MHPSDDMERGRDDDREKVEAEEDDDAPKVPPLLRCKPIDQVRDQHQPRRDTGKRSMGRESCEEGAEHGIGHHPTVEAAATCGGTALQLANASSVSTLCSSS